MWHELLANQPDQGVVLERRDQWHCLCAGHDHHDDHDRSTEGDGKIRYFWAVAVARLRFNWGNGRVRGRHGGDLNFYSHAQRSTEQNVGAAHSWPAASCRAPAHFGRAGSGMPDQLPHDAPPRAALNSDLATGPAPPLLRGAEMQRQQIAVIDDEQRRAGYHKVGNKNYTRTDRATVH